MKKLIFILLCFSLMTFGSSAKIIEVAPAGAWGTMIIGGSGLPAAVGGWSDDFSGCTSGYVDAQTGWGTNLTTDLNANHSADFVCSSGEGLRNADTGRKQYLLADYEPVDTDYSVSVDMKMTTDASTYVGGPCVRAFEDSTGLTGYCTLINGKGNSIYIIKYTNGSLAYLINNQAITNFDWSSYKTIKLVVSGSATTTLTVWIADEQVATIDDSTSPFTTKSYGGIHTYWYADDSADTYADNYVHED